MCTLFIAYNFGSGIFAAVVIFVGGVVACMCITISVGTKVGEKRRHIRNIRNMRLSGSNGHHHRLMFMMFV